MKLIKEKTDQASQLVKEFGFDCWITFVRESEINGDPVLPLILGAEVTCHSAFIFYTHGNKTAIVGKFDVATLEDTGVYDNVIGFVKSIEQPLLDYFKKTHPRGAGTARRD